MASDTLPEKATVGAVWSADQMLAWHLIKKPLGWRDWSEDMRREMPRAQLELSKELGGKTRKAWGIRPGSQGSREQIPDKLFRLEFPVVVDPDGYLRTLHPRDQQKFQEFCDKYEVPEWRGIEFDPDGTPPVAPARRGRPELYDWDEGFQFMRQELDKRSDPKNPINAVKGWRSDADVARLVAAHVAIGNQQPDLKHAARVIAPELKNWRAEQEERNRQAERN